MLWATSSILALSLLEPPSLPSATLTPASSSLRHGAIPAPSFWLEIAL